MHIFSYLNEKEECKTITNCISITSSEFQVYSHKPTCGYGNSPYDALNPANEYVFSTSLNIYNLTFDISSNFPVEIRSYLIETRTNLGPCYWRYPKRFRLFGSKDKVRWKELDNHYGTELSTRAVLTSFPVTKNAGIYSSFRFVVDETDVSSGSWTSISRFEIDGNIIKEVHTCTTRKEISKTLFCIIFLFLS